MDMAEATDMLVGLQSLPIQLQTDPSISDVHMAARRLLYFWIRQYLKDVMFKKGKSRGIEQSRKTAEGPSSLTGSRQSLETKEEKQLDDAATLVERTLYKTSYTLEELLNRITLRKRIKRVVKSFWPSQNKSTEKVHTSSRDISRPKRRKASGERTINKSDERAKTQKTYHIQQNDEASNVQEARQMMRQNSHENSIPSLSSEAEQGEDHKSIIPIEDSSASSFLSTKEESQRTDNNRETYFVAAGLVLPCSGSNDRSSSLRSSISGKKVDTILSL